MPEVVYVLCTLTSTACAVLLLRAYRANRVRLLFWSGLCFVGLALNNALLMVDRMIVPTTDLSILRSSVALVSVSILLFGLVGSQEGGR